MCPEQAPREGDYRGHRRRTVRTEDDGVNGIYLKAVSAKSIGRQGLVVLASSIRPQKREYIR